MKNKRTITILSVLTIIFTLVGGTFAWWTWTSNVTTGVAFTIEKEFSCSADGGQDINSNNIQLIPTSDCTNPAYALQRTIKVTPAINKDNLTISLDMWLTVNSLATPLSESKNLMYAISTVEGSCKSGMSGYVTGGNFNGFKTGSKANLLNGKQYTGKNLPADTYYLYIWLDSEETNNNSQNQSFNFSLGGQCTDSKTLSNTIMSLSNEEGSGVHREDISYGDMGDHNIVPATEAAWSSFTQTGDATLEFVTPAEYGEWQITMNCKEYDDFDKACKSSETKTITLVPKEDGYYELSVFFKDEASFATIYLDEQRVAEVECSSLKCPNSFITNLDEYEVGYVDLGYLTTNSSIKIVVSLHEKIGGMEDMALIRFRKAKKRFAAFETYRYQGENVNNYIKFNNETWRIVGVEEGSDIGREEGSYYTKIIRNEYLEVSSSSYMMYGGVYNFLMLCGFYDLDEEYCEKEFGDISFSSVRLNDVARSMVVEALWYDIGNLEADWDSGPIFVELKIPKEMYLMEKLNSGLYRVPQESKVGVISLGDYGYSGVQSQCANINLANFNQCDTWLKNTSNYRELLTRSDGENGGAHPVINTDGSAEIFAFYDFSTHEYLLDTVSLRPTVYLDSAVVVTKGDGTIENQYEVALAG